MNAPAHPSFIQQMCHVVGAAVKPRERLLVSQWADKYRMLTSKDSQEVGRWRTSRNPMLREIMDCMSLHSPVQEVWVMKSSQVGVTAGPFVSSIGYYMEHAPCPIMVLMPTLDERDKWKLQKLDTMLENTEPIRAALGGLKSRDASNNKDQIDFPGGILYLAGGNSPNSYAQKSVRILEMDDLDRFPAEIGHEGDPVELARSRVKAFRNHKLLFASTPTIKGASHIERGFESGDQRYYYVECPHCGEHQVLRWANVRANQQLTEAYYICEHNGCIIHEHYKPQMLPERGYGGTAYWKPHAPENGRGGKVRSYHTDAIYAPIGLGPSWLDLVIKFKRVHKDPVQLKTFINQELGEPWEDTTDRLKPNELEHRANQGAPYGIGQIPPGCLALTVGIDTQDKWLSVKVLGWGKGEEGAMRHWIVNKFDILGDTTTRQPWDELEAFLNSPVLNSYGREMRYRAAAIDSRGHRTEQVKEFVMRPSLQVKVYSVQGATQRMGRAIAQSGSYPDKNRQGKAIKRGYCVWNIGTEHCKDFIYGHLSSDGEKQPEERTFSFPQGLDDEYYHGLLSETYDPEKKRYVQRLGVKYKRNEPLDTLVYAWAIGQHRDVMIGRGRTGRPDTKYWERLEVMLEIVAAVSGETKPSTTETTAPKVETAAAADPQPTQPQKQKPRGSGFAKDGWGL